jgi:hypothetical protein
MKKVAPPRTNNNKRKLTELQGFENKTSGEDTENPASFVMRAL